MSEPVRALIIEDSTDDVELMLHELAQGGLPCEWKRVDQPEAFRAAIEGEDWDVILSDFNMPRFTAPAALEILQATGKDVPFIIVSGSVGEPTAVQAMKSGAHDFFVKSNLTRLAAAVEREIREARNRRERRLVVSELRRVEERYRLVVENVRDYAIFMLDASGAIESWNQGAERMTGYAAAEIVGQPYATFYEEEERRSGAPQRALREAADAGCHVAEGLRVRKDGTTFWALCTLDRIEVGGALIGYSGIFRDIGERKRLLDDLRQAVRARDEFLSIASHELKTPLTSMELSLEILDKLERADPDVRVRDEKVAKRLSAIRRQAGRLSVLINNLLDVTRITSGRVDLRPERVDLAESMQTVVHRLRDAIERAGCAVTVDAPPGVVGMWDRLRIETVVANLLSNALKYGAGRPIHVVVEQDTARARLCIRDGGIGISPEQQARIFQRFERAVPEQHYGGFGLGLWIVHQIVDAHGGLVRVESQVGEGSTFTVELPLDPGDEHE